MLLLKVHLVLGEGLRLVKGPLLLAFWIGASCLISLLLLLVESGGLLRRELGLLLGDFEHRTLLVDHCQK